VTPHAVRSASKSLPVLHNLPSQDPPPNYGKLRWDQLGYSSHPYALTLLQTSTLISVLLGYKLFKERNIVERVIGFVVMIAGAVLILLRGG
jgi:hypothetical protein